MHVFIMMIKAPKVIVTTQACLWWGQELWAHPYTSMKWGRDPAKCECGGRIVGVRSTEQSVFNHNVTFGVRIIMIKKYYSYEWTTAG